MTVLKVEKMKCGGCATAVEGAIKALDAKAEVRVDLASKRVEVKSAQVGAEALASAVSKAGYPATAG